MIKSLLAQITSSDNALRHSAEMQLNQNLLVSSQPDSFILDLLSFSISNGTQDCVDASVELRVFGLILLRRIFNKSFHKSLSMGEPGTRVDLKTLRPLCERISTETKQKIQNMLFDSLRASCFGGKGDKIGKKICDLIADLSSLFVNRLDLLALLSELSSKSGSSVFPFWIVESASADLLFDLPPENISSFFLNGLQHNGGNELVVVEAFRCCVAYTTSVPFESTGYFKIFAGQIFPKMIDILSTMFQSLAAKNAQQQDRLIDCLEAVLELLMLDKLVKMISSSIPQLASLLLSNLSNLSNSVGVDEAVDMRIRTSSLEILVSLSECSPLCKSAEYANSLVHIVLDSMAEIPDNLLEDDDSEGNGDDEGIHVIAEQALDRLSFALGPLILAPVFQRLPLFLADGWKRRYAVFMAIGAVAEGCVDALRTEAVLKELMAEVMRGLSDTESRVRYAVFNCVGQLCTDLCPDIQLLFHAGIVKGICAALDDVDRHPMLAKQASAALINFCEGATSEFITPHLPHLVPRFSQLLLHPNAKLREQVITTIATVADCAGLAFAPFYPGILPTLMGMVNGVLSETSADDLSVTADNKNVLGKLIECISLILLAVGGGKGQTAAISPLFKHQDMEVITGVIMKIQNFINGYDDPLVSYVLTAWARICRVMGAELFMSIMPFVETLLFAVAAAEPAVIRCDNETQGEGEGWKYVQVDGQLFAVNVSCLQEKCGAISILSCFARTLGPAFVQEARRGLEIVVPLLKYYLNEDVIWAASQCIPALLSCFLSDGRPVCEAGELKMMWTHVACGYAEVISEQSFQQEGEGGCESGLFVQHLQSFKECFDMFGLGSLDGDDGVLENTCMVVVAQVQKALMAGDPASEGVEDAEANAADVVLGELSNLINTIIKTQPFNNNLNPLIQLAAALLQNTDMRAKQFGLCIWDDIIEYCPLDRIWDLRTLFWDRLVEALSYEGMRQAASYGIGILAMKAQGNGRWTEALLQQGIVDALWIAALDKEARDLLARDNVISAIGKCLRLSDPREKVVLGKIESWIGMLPLVADGEEAAICSAYISELLLSGQLGRHVSTLALTKIKQMLDAKLFEPTPEILRMF